MIKANYTDLKDIEISKEKQQEIKQADYFGGKKCIVYNDNEEYKLCQKNLDYCVSNYGNVYSFSKKKKLTPRIDKDGYERVNIGGKVFGVHRLVMEHFCPNENSDKLQVTHLDYNKQRNVYDERNDRINLSWMSPQEIIQRAIETGHRMPDGENHHKAKYKEDDIWKICGLISKGFTGRQIATELGMEYTPQLQDLTTKIKLGKSWTKISSQFPNIQAKSRNRKDK